MKQNCDNCVYVIRSINKNNGKIELRSCGKKIAIPKKNYKCKEWDKE